MLVYKKKLTIGGTNVTFTNTRSDRYFQLACNNGQYNLYKLDNAKL